MPTPEVTIQMDQNTFTALMNGGFCLYAFTAVQCSDRGGLPAVWQCTQTYSLTTTVAVPQNYDAFTAAAMPLTPASIVSPWFTAPIQEGQILEINQAGGTGQVKGGGEAGTVTILNQTSNQYTCGLTQQSGPGFAPAPVCAFSLYGNGIQLITPLPSVLLLFSTIRAVPGTLIEVSKGPGVLVNLANGNSPTISFDINKGWSWGGYAWAQAIPANSDLRPVLIQYSQALAKIKTRTAEEELSKAV